MQVRCMLDQYIIFSVVGNLFGPATSLPGVRHLVPLTEEALSRRQALLAGSASRRGDDDLASGEMEVAVTILGHDFYSVAAPAALLCRRKSVDHVLVQHRYNATGCVALKHQVIRQRRCRYLLGETQRLQLAPTARHPPSWVAVCC